MYELHSKMIVHLHNKGNFTRKNLLLAPGFQPKTFLLMPYCLLYRDCISLINHFAPIWKPVFWGNLQMSQKPLLYSPSTLPRACTSNRVGFTFSYQHHQAPNIVYSPLNWKDILDDPRRDYLVIKQLSLIMPAYRFQKQQQHFKNYYFVTI